MSKLSYGSFEEILRSYIKPEIIKRDLANILFLSPVKLELKETHKVDNSTVSRVCSGERPLPPRLLEYYTDPNALKRIIAVFSTDIIRHIQDVENDALVQEIIALIQEDEAMPQETKVDFEMSAKTETLCEFLAKTYMYAITREDRVQKVENLPRQNQFFHGREEMLTTIHMRYLDDVHIQGLHGMGGVGKTQIALQYAHLHFDEYDTIWWINAESKTTLQDSISKFLSTIKRLPKGKATDSVRMTFLRYLDKHSGWLLIYDNAEYGTDIEYETLSSYIPGNPKGHILLTTRCSDAFENAVHMEVEIFGAEEAVDFLQHRSRMKDAFNAAKVSAQLGYLPLALEYAAAYIRETHGVDYATYSERLERYGIKVLDRAVGHRAYKNTVRQAFHITLDKILEDAESNRISKSTEQFLDICAYLAPDKIDVNILSIFSDNLPEPVKQTLKDELDRDELVRNLTKYSLVQVVKDELSIHRLLQEILIDEMVSNDREEWIQRVRNVFQNFLFYIREIPLAIARPIISSSIPHVQSVLTRYVQLCKGKNTKIKSTDLWEIEREFCVWTMYQLTDNDIIFGIPLKSGKWLKYAEKDLDTMQIAVDFYDTVLNNENIFLAYILLMINQSNYLLTNRVNLDQCSRAVKIVNSVIPAKLPKNNKQYQSEALYFGLDIFYCIGEIAILNGYTNLGWDCYAGLIKMLQVEYEYFPYTEFLDLHIESLLQFRILSDKLAQCTQRAFLTRIKIPRGMFNEGYMMNQGYRYTYFYPTKTTNANFGDTGFDIIFQDYERKNTVKKLNRPWTTLAFPENVRSLEDMLEYLMGIDIEKQFSYARQSLYEAIAVLADELNHQDVSKRYWHKLQRLNHCDF